MSDDSPPPPAPPPEEPREPLGGDDLGLELILYVLFLIACGMAIYLKVTP